MIPVDNPSRLIFALGILITPVELELTSIAC